MKKKGDKFERRAKHVQKRINKCKSVEKEIKKLANELFLDERTIKRDIERDV